MTVLVYTGLYLCIGDCTCVHWTVHRYVAVRTEELVQYRKLYFRTEACTFVQISVFEYRSVYFCTDQCI